MRSDSIDLFWAGLTWAGLSCALKFAKIAGVSLLPDFRFPITMSGVQSSGSKKSEGVMIWKKISKIKELCLMVILRVADWYGPLKVNCSF